MKEANQLQLKKIHTNYIKPNKINLHSRVATHSGKLREFSNYGKSKETQGDSGKF